jgi:hypothetical protein
MNKRAIEFVIDFIGSMQPLACLFDSTDEADGRFSSMQLNVEI